MKADCHDPVGGVKGFFHSVSVMHVDVDVEDSVVVLEQLQDRYDDVVNKAEPTCLGLFGVMQSTCPVYAHVCHPVVQHDCCINTPTC